MSGWLIIMGWVLAVAVGLWIVVGKPIPQRRASYRSIPKEANGSDKPFPNSRPQDGSSPNPYFSQDKGYNPLERDMPEALDDRVVYWEAEESTESFTKSDSCEANSKSVLSRSESSSNISPIIVEFPEYDHSIDYAEYKGWQKHCVKLGRIVPYRVYMEFKDE